MKETSPQQYSFAFGGARALLNAFLAAGMLVVSSFSSPSPAPAQTSPPQLDSVVAIVADTQGLALAPPDEQPQNKT